MDETMGMKANQVFKSVTDVARDPATGFGCGFSTEIKFPSMFEICKPNIKKVIFNRPATIIYWSDSTKTVVKCMENEYFDKEKGLAMAITKKMLGDNFHKDMKFWLNNADEF